MAETNKPAGVPEAGDAIPAREAVRAASAYYRDITGSTQPVTLEEIELTEDGRFWLVTLGMVVPALNTNPLANLMIPQSEVSYKVFRIDARTGKVKSMKLREIK
jgi:hypothetical protein